MARRIVLRSEPSSEEDLTIDYEGALNPQQHAAATAGDGPLLIVAGAGTGKTRTLIYRLAYLVETGTRPEQIVLLTFTRRAANDMTARAASLLDGRCEKVQGGTFHAFCLQVLRRHAPVLDLPRNFTVLDAADAADVLGVLRARGVPVTVTPSVSNTRFLRVTSNVTVSPGSTVTSRTAVWYPTKENSSVCVPDGSPPSRYVPSAPVVVPR